MLEKKGDEWKDKLRIIGLSIDSAKETVKSHVENKGWTAVEHYFRAGSKCSEVYGVRGVPHVMLIDKEGTIVYKGHPASRPNLEEDLDKLLKGEKLEGQGIAELKQDDGTPEIKLDEGFKKLEGDLNAEIERFKEACSGF